MPPMSELPHILIGGPTQSLHFTSVPQQGASLRLPPRQRAEHGAYLIEKLERAWDASPSNSVVGHQDNNGVYLEFKSSPGFELKIKSLEDLRSKKIRLCNVRKRVERIEEDGRTIEKEQTLATVFVANDKKNFFFDRISDYLSKETPTNRPKNADLVDGIDDLQRAVLQSFWVDDIALIPGNSQEWVEVWLRADSETDDEPLLQLLNINGIPYKSERLVFPERIVRLVFANSNQLTLLTRYSDAIAEFRYAKSTAEFWVAQSNAAQAEWVNNLLRRLIVDDDTDISICLLDTGVSSGHPLISPLLSDRDCLSVQNQWGTYDHIGHGTRMAGLAAYGDLQTAVESNSLVRIGHRIESIKIIPPPSAGGNSRELWGDITSQGISLAEINSPDRSRINCMAVTAIDTRDRGRPTSWSAAIDKLCFGDDISSKRLFIQSAGNADVSTWGIYPDGLATDSIHDPGQSWNALTVGAFTQRTIITDHTLADFRPIAEVNQLSPFSTTSLTWQKQWPIKPEVVFEGGNAAVDTGGFVTDCADLSLLSTNHNPIEGHFAPFSMTSAASAQAANFAAKIQKAYPTYWPETVRGLIVHSAVWPEALISQFAPGMSKTEVSSLLRWCGYGVPDLSRAIHCASNSLTLVVQSTIQPYEMREEPTKAYRTKDMHLYQLPWPVEELQQLGETPVEMRVTLSYYIEPGPGEVGWKDRYRYPSFLLRFDLNSPGEGQDEFVHRINAAVRDEENGHPGTESPADHWVIGSHGRDKGSIHSDIWKGTAAQLAGSNLVAVSPRIGWWRERAYLGKYAELGRYALIISISTPEVDVDIYTPVAQKVATPISIRARR